MKSTLILSLLILSFSNANAIAGTPKIIYKSDLNLTRSTKSYPMIQRMCDNFVSVNSGDNALNFSQTVSEHAFYFATGKFNSNKTINTELKRIYNKTTYQPKPIIPLTHVELAIGVFSNIDIDCSIMKVTGLAKTESSTKITIGDMDDMSVSYGGKFVSNLELNDSVLKLTFNLPVFEYVIQDMYNKPLSNPLSRKLLSYNKEATYEIYDLRDPKVEDDIKNISKNLNLKNSTDGYLLAIGKFPMIEEVLFVPAKNKAELVQFVNELKLMNQEVASKIFEATPSNMVAFSFDVTGKATLSEYIPVAKSVKDKYIELSNSNK